MMYLYNRKDLQQFSKSDNVEKLPFLFVEKIALDVKSLSEEISLKIWKNSKKDIRSPIMKTILSFENFQLILYCQINFTKSHDTNFYKILKILTYIMNS